MQAVMHGDMMIDRERPPLYQFLQEKIEEVIGHLDEDTMVRLGRSLMLWVGLG